MTWRRYLLRPGGDAGPRRRRAEAKRCRGRSGRDFPPCPYRAWRTCGLCVNSSMRMIKAWEIYVNSSMRMIKAWDIDVNSSMRMIKAWEIYVNSSMRMIKAWDIYVNSSMRMIKAWDICVNSSMRMIKAWDIDVIAILCHDRVMEVVGDVIHDGSYRGLRRRLDRCDELIQLGVDAVRGLRLFPVGVSHPCKAAQRGLPTHRRCPSRCWFAEATARPVLWMSTSKHGMAARDAARVKASLRGALGMWVYEMEMVRGRRTTLGPALRLGVSPSRHP
eukprot:1191503-Prorocentrum_minimum.AAC.2